MLFSSPIFLFFFLPLVIAGYHLAGKRSRIYFLLFASLFFYAWGEPGHILVMALSITVNYVFGLLIHRAASKTPWQGRLLLFAAAAGNLGILFYFKYLNFTIQTINRILNAGIDAYDIVMPIGISFFTFQGMSYVIDLYRGKIAVQKNPALVAFYISFFPQLVAGPIVRYIDIEGQIYSRAESLDTFVAGAKRFILGLSKKVMIANTLGHVTDQVFAVEAVGNAPATAWLGILCYTFQIYFDFSGYSDMAIGLGKMFGFDFLENFKYPYMSKTVTEFWRRWHISLSSWFRDYLYIPLGGNRKGNVYVNLLIVFAVTGFWHGASFNFLVWGLWHGCFLMVERALKITEAANRLFVPVRYMITMLAVVCGWVFFRAEGTLYARRYLGVMFGLVQPAKYALPVWYYLDMKTVCAFVVAVVASFPVAETGAFGPGPNTLFRKCASNALFLALFAVSAAFVVASRYNPFIYFKF